MFDLTILSYMQCIEATIYWYIDCYITFDDTMNTS